MFSASRRGEKGQAPSDLGIVDGATMVMVPVKVFVESCTGSNGSGVVSTLTGVAGSVASGIGYYLGWGPSQPAQLGNGIIRMGTSAPSVGGTDIAESAP